VTGKTPKSRTRTTPSAGKEQGRYANFFQIGHNAFEFLIEFGQQDGGIHTRIYVSPQHARILSDLLVKTLRQHEGIFGSLTRPEHPKRA
jgi:uncharacterized protein DUF3467